MARYTELFAEWLEEGGELPDLFSAIQIGDNNLSDIFTAHFAAREIGFETPILFKLKLNEYAAILIPQLESDLKILDAAKGGILEPTFKRTKSGALTRNYGATKRNTWENPTAIATSTTEIDLTDAGSQQIIADAQKVDQEQYDNVTDTETGYRVTDALQIMAKLTEETDGLLNSWLKKFDPLFMQIY